MNNWHLLLLALAAVCKPITSFTERNLVDGRQQCCDRETDIGLKDGRSSLYGTHRLSKASTLLRRLNDWDETRRDRRADLRQRDTVITRRSKKRSLLDNRERDSIRIPSNLVRFTRVENRPERLSVYDNGGRRVDVERRNRYTRSIDDINSEGQSNTRTRDSVMRYDDETTESQARYSVSRNDVRIRRFSNEHGNRQEVVRQRTNAVKRETLSRGEVRRYINNNDERERERHAEQRRALSESSRVDDRIHNMRLRDNSRDEIRNNRDDVSTNQRFMKESSAERRQLMVKSRGNIRQSNDRRRSRENDNDERRERERYAEQRRALSESSRLGERINKMRSRDNSRDAIRENRDRESTNQRFTRDTSEEQRQLMVESRGHIRQSTDRRLSPENNNDERRERERYAYQRRALSENSRIEDRIHNMLFRDNSWNKNRENRDRVSTGQRFRRERSEERRQQLDESRDHIRQTIDRRLSQENNNDERRERERYTEQRQALSERSRVDKKIHNMRLRDNSRDEIRVTRDRLSTNQRFMREISGERRQPMVEFRELNRQNIDRRLSREDINDERREHERYVKQPRALSESSKVDERLYNMRSRDNSRDEIQENRDRVNTNQRLMRERSEEQRQLMDESRESKRQNTERSLSRQNNNDDRHERERYTQQRRTLLLSSRVDEQIRNIRSRVNSREEIRENGDRVSHQQFMRERTADRSREHTGQNNDRRLSRGGIEMAVRVTSVPKTMNNINIRLDRAIESRQDIRYNERQNRDTRDNKVLRERHFTSRDSRKLPSMEQNTLISDRRARSLDLRNFRDVRVEPKLSQVAEMVRESNAPRIPVEYRNNKNTNERDAIETRFRQIENRNPNMIDKDMKVEDVTEKATNNWHYILYTLQSAYLCGLFMQMMLPNRSEKSKMMNLRWWSNTLIKVD